MSYTEIYVFGKDGYPQIFAEVQNAWRSAPAIWNKLDEKYLPPYLPEYAKNCGFQTAEEYNEFLGVKLCRFTTMSSAAMQDIWDLVTDDRVLIADKICLYTTFDKCLIRYEDIPAVVDAFRSFEGETSLKEQADILEKIYSIEGCIAVGWNQTSVNGDTWRNYTYDEETDKSIPYNCLTDTEHYFLFDDLNKTDKEDAYEG